MSASFNDLWCFNTNEKQWIEIEPDGVMPKKRISHVSGFFGCIMLTHGGFNSEAKKLLDDFNLYDVQLNKWLKVTVYLNG